MCSSKFWCGWIIGKEEDGIEDDGPWLACTSCCSLFLFATLFLLQVASISKSKEAKFFPRIQENNYHTGYHRIKIKNEEWIKKIEIFLFLFLFLKIKFKKKLKNNCFKNLNIQITKYKEQSPQQTTPKTCWAICKCTKLSQVVELKRKSKCPIHKDFVCT